MKQEVLIGQTDYTVLVLIRDDAGAPKTGLTEASIDIAYARVETENDVTTSDVTPAALSALTDAHTDWGFEEVSATDHPGLYRLDIADAVFASGAWSAVVSIVGTGLDPTSIEFVLVAFNPRDGVRLGLTALPNAAADAAGGLIISDAGGLDADAQRTNISGIVTSIGTIEDLGTGATVAKNLVDIEAHADNVGVGGASLNAIPWNAAWDAEVESEVTDALNSYDPPTRAELTTDTNSILSKLLKYVQLVLRKDAAIATDNATEVTAINADGGSGAGAFANTTDSQEAIRDKETDIETDTADIQSRLPAALVSGRIDASVGAMAANVLTASALATDAVNEIVDQTWREAISDHSGTAGSTAEALNAAGAAGDPWTTALPGAYGAGSAGNIIGNNLNATVSSRSSHSAADVWSSATRTLTAFDAAFKTGYALSSAGVQAIWDALTSALTTVGSIGKLLVDNINATIGSRASQTTADAIETDTQDIQSKIGTPAGVSVSADILVIDNLVDDLESRIGTPSNFGSGATVAANLVDIEGQTDDIGAAGAGLTALASAASLSSLDTKIGTPAGASVSADILTIDNLVDDLEGRLTSTRAGYLDNLNALKVKKNSALANFTFKMVQSADHVTPATGLTITATRSLDGAAFAACTNSASEISAGFYKINLAAGDLNGDVVALKFTATGADQRDFVITTQP